MSKRQMLRALVNERLCAAAEEIFALFERTISEYEEELCRFKEQENQRKQQQQKQLPDLDYQIPPGHTLNQEITENQEIIEFLHIKEEPEERSVKQEVVLLPESPPESSAFSVKREEPSLLQRGQVEHREGTKGENVGSDATDHSSDTDSWPGAQLDTWTAAQASHLETSATVNNEGISGTDDGAERKHQCFFCQKRFKTKQHLQVHIRSHTGEKPFSCSVCQKTFVHKGSLVIHRRIHTGEKPYSCPFCNNTYGHKGYLQKHMRTHTGERPYSCTVCGKTFSQKSNLEVHKRTHTGDKPYSCSICNITFIQKTHRESHMRILHSAE